MPRATLDEWAWRVPFLLGGLAGPVGFYIRRRVAESPEFAALQRHKGTVQRAPVAEVLKHHLQPTACALGFIAVATANNYTFNTYLPVFVQRQLHLPLSAALIGAVVGGFISMVLYPLIGWMSDRVGPYIIFFTAVVLGGVLVYPLFVLVTGAPDSLRLFAVQIVMLVIHAFMVGPAPGLLARLFPVSVRSTGMSLSYNLAVTLFGGLAPATVTWLIRMTGSNLMPAFYLVAVTVFSLIVVGLTRPRPGEAVAAAE